MLRPKDRSYSIDETRDGLAANLRHHALGQLAQSLRASLAAFVSCATIRVLSQPSGESAGRLIRTRHINRGLSTPQGWAATYVA